MHFKKFLISILLIFSLTACGKKTVTTDESGFLPDEDFGSQVDSYTDTLQNAVVKFSQNYTLGQTFKVNYKTYNPDGVGQAEFKAESIKVVDSVADRTPSEGKKLVLVKIAVKGNAKNTGEPGNFNQIGQHPSPQFILVDPDQNLSYVETTYFSDAYTADNKLFELSKITLDHEIWVNTALVFEINQDLAPNLAFRFTNPDGQTEFYDLAD